MFNIILGILLVVIGRRLFWLSVGIIGFLSGAEWGSILFPQADPVMIFAIAIVFGIGGVLLAVGFQWVAVILIGFLGGGYFFIRLGSFSGLSTEPATIASFLIGGILGMIAMLLGFDIALIIITSFIGAMLIAENLLFMYPWLQSLLLFSIAMLGIILQAPDIRVQEERGPKNA